MQVIGNFPSTRHLAVSERGHLGTERHNLSIDDDRLCIDMRIDMRTDMRIDTRLDIGIDMCADSV